MEKHPQCVMDSNGMIIEKSDSFQTNISGYILDISQKARDVLESKDGVNSIELFFDNKVILIKDNCVTGINMSMIVENKDL